MALEEIELLSVKQLYNFVESCGVPSGLILDHDAPHRPWARSVSSSCSELKWYYPESPVPTVLRTHLANFAHQSLPETGILLIRNGQVYQVIDVDRLNGRAEPDRLGSFVKQVWNQDTARRSTASRPEQHAMLDDPFSVLDCSPTDSISAIKRRYKELLLQYHPDKVAHLGPALRDLATAKTREINLAFAAIRKKLGF